MAKATIVNPSTGERRAVNVGTPLPNGFQLETTDPNKLAGNFTSSMTPDQVLTALRQQLDTGQAKLNTLQQLPFVAPQALRTALQGLSPEFNLSRSDLEARFGNPKSKTYISNPFVRESVIQQSLAGREQSFGNVSSSISNMLGLASTQQGQVVSGIQSQVSYYQDLADRLAKQRQQEFENQLALQQLSISRANAARESAPSLQDSLIVNANGQQVGKALYNPKTGNTEYRDLNNNVIAFPEGGQIVNQSALGSADTLSPSEQETVARQETTYNELSDAVVNAKNGKDAASQIKALVDSGRLSQVALAQFMQDIGTMDGNTPEQKLEFYKRLADAGKLEYWLADIGS